MYCTCCWNGSQHVVKPDVGSESRFLPTPPAFDALVRGVPVGMLLYAIWYEKLEWCGYPVVKNFLKICLFVLTEYTNVTDTRTDRQTDTAWRRKLRLYSIARQKLEWFGYPTVKKILKIRLFVLTIHECDRRTHTQTPHDSWARLQNNNSEFI